MTPPAAAPRRVVVVGGGPGGLMAAEVLAAGGASVTVFEHMRSAGRKLLLAGRSGLNLTHSEPLEQMVQRYLPRDPRLEAAVRAFDPTALRDWCAGLGEPTFVGSSGRVFPQSFRATPLLRAWLRRLADAGVAFETQHRWLGFASPGLSPDGALALRFSGPDGGTVDVSADACVLALGGASWPRVGSDGGWAETLRAAGVSVTDLLPANCGVHVTWSTGHRERFAGVPLKNVAVTTTAGGEPVRGDLMVTRSGLEGGPVYAHSAAIRTAIARDGDTTIWIDLHPDLDVERVEERLGRRRPKDSVAETLRRTLGLSPVAISMLRESTGNHLPADQATLARLVKSLPVTVTATAPIERAISTAGGIGWSEIDDGFMLRRLPGVFVAGEMLDWEAPTGGYLLQATFSTAVAAARGAISWLATTPPRFERIDAGDTLWRFDTEFLQSNWTCIWGRGCHGILPERAAHLAQGCCSLGAELDGDDEARTLAATATALTPEAFEFHAEAAADGVFSDATWRNTRVVDGACIFLNRPGFPGGAGCALHLAALAADESPIDWKPSVCWQVPIRVDWELGADGVETATVRRWRRQDWGADGEVMSWCCTEEPEAYVGDQPLVETMKDELTEIVGEAVYVELRRRWGSR